MLIPIVEKLMIWLFPLIGITSRTYILNEIQCNLRVTNGTVICVGDLDKTVCEVTCNGKFQGEFHCSTDGGWKEKLPGCVKETKDLFASIAVCPNEELYSECHGHCDRSCSNWDKPSSCAPNVCVGACVCGEGLVRGPDGKCVSADTCTANGPCFLQVENGKVGCIGDNRITCEVSCDGVFQGRYHCSKDKGWEEKLPYCVKQTKDFSSIARCKSKEVYSECRGHCEKNCFDLDKSTECSPNICVAACICGGGLVRGSNGQCIPVDSCPVSSYNLYSSRLKIGFFGCPDHAKCDEHCKEQEVKFKGHCIGPDELFCTCL